MNWLTDEHRSALHAVRADIRRILGQELAGVRECALIDFPDHGNVGDSLIWLGELGALAELGIAVKYVCTVHDYNRTALARALPQEGAILLHGGGNFGTLYVRHQQLRERILSDFPERRTIQLPQSIHFEPGDVLLRTQALVAKHKNLTLLVRDRRSFRFATDNFACATTLCPDMALMLNQLSAGPQPEVDYFVLARDDRERGSAWSEALAAQDPATCRSGDWLTQEAAEASISGATRVVRRLLRGVQAADAAWEPAYRQAALARMRRGVRTLSQGRVVLTDRLHAHVLCVLLGKPHVVLGDAYGKIRAFYEAYSSRLSPAPWCDSPADAFAAGARLIGSTGRGSPAAAYQKAHG